MYSSVRALRLNNLVKNSKFSIAINALKHGDPLLLPLTKIVATIGPASENLPVLPSVVRAGMRIMRINFSHATYDEANLRVGNLKKCNGLNKASDENLNMRSILLDTQGPEIRTGSFGNGVKEVDLVAGEKVVLTSDPAYQHNQSKDTVWLSYAKLYDTLQQGSSILLDDGIIEVQVDSKSKTAAGHAHIVCTIVNSGSLGNKKGVNMPGLSVDLPAMSEKDRKDIRWGIENDIDYIAASFVRKPSDVLAIREYTESLLKELHPTSYQKYHVPKIISKIESTEALENFDEILAVSDGIMVARGDLAVEIPMETLATVSKEIVRRSVEAGKPVVVATQMLESMQKNPRPTRAECTDVANAVLDGADCVMLSGESAKGKYPVGAISMMNRIVLHTEHDSKLTNKLSLTTASGATSEPIGQLSAEASTARAAVTLATSMKELKGIVINMRDSSASLDSVFSQLTQTQQMAALVSHYRPQVPIFVAVPNHKIGRLLQMHRGLHPIVASGSDADVLTYLDSTGLVKRGENVLLLSREEKSKRVNMYLETSSA